MVEDHGSTSMVKVTNGRDSMFNVHVETVTQHKRSSSLDDIGHGDQARLENGPKTGIINSPARAQARSQARARVRTLAGLGPRKLFGPTETSFNGKAKGSGSFSKPAAAKGFGGR